LKTKMLNRFALFLATATMTLSCSSNKSNSLSENTNFSTRISDSGLKHFELRHSIHEGHPSTKQAVTPQNNRARPDSKKSLAKQLKSLDKLASKYIEENGYCKTGYWILDADTDPRGTYIRGECNDIATDDDRINFPDSIKNW